MLVTSLAYLAATAALALASPLTGRQTGYCTTLEEPCNSPGSEVTGGIFGGKPVTACCAGLTCTNEEPTVVSVLGRPTVAMVGVRSFVYVGVCALLNVTQTCAESS